MINLLPQCLYVHTLKKAVLVSKRVSQIKLIFPLPQAQIFNKREKNCTAWQLGTIQKKASGNQDRNKHSSRDINTKTWQSQFMLTKLLIKKIIVVMMLHFNKEKSENITNWAVFHR